MKNTMFSLFANLVHQHSKVRKITMKSLADVAVCRGAEPFLEEGIEQLKYTQNDRSQDVRKTFYTVLQHWLINMEINSIIYYEKYFVLFLLNGAADENRETAKLAIETMEKHGKNMKEALIKLGEEKPDEDMKDESK